MGGGGGGGGFGGTKGAPIPISDKAIHQTRKHFNKHGREMGYANQKAYDAGAKEFARKYQDHPDAKVFDGEWNGRGDYNGETQRIITYGNRTVIINLSTGQIIDFYRGSDYRGLIHMTRIR